MKNYELTCLISPDLSGEETNSLLTEINLFIQEKQGILEKSLPLSKKELSYPIKKKTTAYLASLNFQTKPEDLVELKKLIEANSKILRYLIITIIKEKFKKPSRSIKIPIITKKRKEFIPEKKIKLEEIEKKLEEIL